MVSKPAEWYQERARMNGCRELIREGRLTDEEIALLLGLDLIVVKVFRNVVERMVPRER